VLAYRVGTPPFSFGDRDGRVRAYSVELCANVATLVGRQLGLKDLRIEWMPVDADVRIEVVASGRADAECGTTTITLSLWSAIIRAAVAFISKERRRRLTLA
jgi:glutamate/aspartate transport system substrate-binding protein